MSDQQLPESQPAASTNGPASADATNVPPPEPTPKLASPSGETTISKKWSIKIAIMTLVMMVLGVWGTVDAIWVYPKRGARAAEYSEFQHLSDMKDRGQLTNDQASIAAPAEKLADLQERQSQSGGQALSSGELARKEWLTQLRLIGKLSPEQTKFPRTDFRVEGGTPVSVGSADERLAQLTTKYVTPEGNAIKPPSPLSWYDIPSQWLIAGVGFGFGLYLLALIAKVRRKRYAWDAATKTLSLPGGHTLQPSDIAEFDKSKWDKLYIHLVIKPEHKTLGGMTLELDLLRYVPLEGWILEMEQIAGKA